MWSTNYSQLASGMMMACITSSNIQSSSLTHLWAEVRVKIAVSAVFWHVCAAKPVQDATCLHGAAQDWCALPN